MGSSAASLDYRTLCKRKVLLEENAKQRSTHTTEEFSLEPKSSHQEETEHDDEVEHSPSEELRVEENHDHDDPAKSQALQATSDCGSTAYCSLDEHSK